MTPTCLPWVEVVLSGEVVIESLRPILSCLHQLVSANATYVIRAEDVTRIELPAAELLLDFVDDAIHHGSTVRWAAASHSLIQTVRAVAFPRESLAS